MPHVRPPQLFSSWTVPLFGLHSKTDELCMILPAVLVLIYYISFLFITKIVCSPGCVERSILYKKHVQVSCPRTQHDDPGQDSNPSQDSNPDLSIWRLQYYSWTSLIRTPKGRSKVSVLERCPYYRGHEYDITFKALCIYHQDFLSLINWLKTNASFIVWTLNWDNWLTLMCNHKHEIVLNTSCWSVRNKEVKFIWICSLGPIFSFCFPY